MKEIEFKFHSLSFLCILFYFLFSTNICAAQEELSLDMPDFSGIKDSAKEILNKGKEKAVKLKDKGAETFDAAKEKVDNAKEKTGNKILYAVQTATKSKFRHNYLLWKVILQG